MMYHDDQNISNSKWNQLDWNRHRSAMRSDVLRWLESVFLLTYTVDCAKYRKVCTNIENTFDILDKLKCFPANMELKFRASLFLYTFIVQP